MPRWKPRMKRVYQTLMYMKSKKKYRVKVHDQAKLVEVEKEPNSGSFFGYYTHSSEHEGKQLYLRYPLSELRQKRSMQLVQVCVDGKIEGETTCWNWQQGAMLHWVGKDEIIWNRFNAEKASYEAVWKKLEGEEKVFSLPVYSVSNKGKYYLSLNFSRLAKYRPDYGYFNLPYEGIKPLDEEDGIFKISFVDGKVEKLISIGELSEFQPKASMQEASHKVNHIDISPDGTRFLFMHRWYDKNGIKHSRLFLCDEKGDELKLLSDGGMISHSCWKRNNEIIVWMEKNEKCGYYLMNVDTMEDEILGKGKLTEDGHPSVSPCGEWMVTDTYPDKARMAHLYLYYFEKKKVIHLGEFFSPLFFHGENRCDLHPRWNSDGTSMTFDSVHDGVRRMWKLDIQALLREG